MPKPICTILAGPNGSGKSSIYEKYRPAGDFVNTDEIQKSLPQGLAESANRVKAGRIAITRINQLIAAKADFVFETTLGSEHSIKVIERAKEAGFLVNMIFVCLDTATRNVERVRFRVADGGHDIPEEAIIRRYEAAFENLPRALHVVDEAVLIDNSRRKPVIVATMENSKAIQAHYEGSELHDRLLDIVEDVEENRSTR
ncbi:zeta toxin family protein [Rhizobium sp. VS19-DR104.2]|uniref:zeta toxin family protein n=1 Tax=unclassified Rhizobium TaxID=2613769 RepID=UPI001CC7B6F1|nr:MULTISPECIES: zeta toxin family protein [unclassified Rhizobium]MBZ5761946.1 zeta toxin family protein [Rhizobium sp. VS19-DR96]MBZ5768918.1 zeta toxin family protein [Rhizobium sp. VS19-DR129.2]MBZ5775678.1 zeta toxin family protein [Rhizobium sp. VS19-DRK62.2]MBZ5786824.1 zeta toxin family protein [Rhizobium sp. VS19-DR121]MBZ5805034.1 zeta toxin family protein [Rhizobium sp. VS19-DR181]